MRSSFRAPTWMRSLLAIVMVVSLMPTFGGTAHAAVATPTGLSPASGAATSSTPVLKWTRVAGATRYDVEVSTAATFASIIFTRSTTNQQIVPTTELPSGDVYWRVRGVDASGAGSWATTWMAVNLKTPPVQLSPANTIEDVLDQPGEPPLLTWRAVQGATSYTVEVDTETDFVGASSYTTKSTSLVVPDPKADGQYFWRVRAQLSSGLYTDFSTVWTYKIGPLAQVNPTSPAQGKALTDVVLEWPAVLGAKTYELQVSTDQDFNTIVDSKTNIRGTRYSPATTYLNDQYYWRVRARNNLGQTFEWVEVQPRPWFQRNWPTAPALQFPPDATGPAVGDDLYFQWTPVDHATRYQLDLGTDPNFSPTTFATCYTAATTFTPGATTVAGGVDKCMPSQGGTYYWRVRGLDEPSNTQGIYSPIRMFSYDSGIVELTSPADGAAVAVPVLEWAAARDAEQYRVLILDTNGRTVADVKTYALAWTPTTALDPAKGPFTWTVQAVDGDGKLSPRYGGRTFFIAGTPPMAGAAPLEPLSTGTETARFPVLRWEPMDGAAFYRINIGVAGSGYWMDPASGPTILKDKHPYPAASDRTDKLMSARSYDWQVEAFSSAGVSLGRGGIGSFTIKDLPPVTGQRLALTGTSLDANKTCTTALGTTNAVCANVPTTPVLDWAPVPGAGLYMVYVARDRELTNLVYKTVPWTINSRWTPSSILTPNSLPDTQAGQAYFWFIRPCKTRNVCGPDPVSTAAAAQHAFSKTSPPVALVAPADGGGVANQVTFEWQDYLTTNQLKTYAATGEKSLQSGKQYRIQVSSSPSFATFIDNQLVDQTTYTAWDRTYPEGRFYWRVQAVDAAGNGLTWSPTRSFVKASTKPVLTSPVGSVTSNGVAPFSWKATEFAGSYQLEVYKNDDTAWSPSNRVVSVTTKQTAYAHSTPLPASANAYVWRVARLDADGRPGQWSDTGRFFWSGAKTNLAAPAANATVSGASPYFSWSSVPGAVTYRFERRLVGGSSLSENVTTNATAWAPTALIAAGNWEWRVVAIDAARAEIGASDWRPFVVLAALTATPQPTIIGTPKVGATLTANPGAWAPSPVTFAYQWFRSGTAISGATASTYVPTGTDYGKTMSVRVTGSKAGYTTVAKTSAASAPVAAGSLSPTPVPTISGTVKAGYTLTAVPGTWGPAPVTLSYQWYRGGAAVTGATSPTYALGQADVGYQMAVRVVGRKTGYTAVSKSSTLTAAVLNATATSSAQPTPIAGGGLTRIAGNDRYATTVLVSKKTFPAPQGTVFVASGENYPDALAGGPIAARLKAPILLVGPRGIPSVVQSELTRLAPAKIYILGGPGAVSDGVKSQLVALTGAAVTRVSGVDRYATAAATAKLLGTPSTVYIASGEGFADALAGGAAAARQSAVILLTAPSRLPVATQQTLAAMKPSRVVVLGGRGAVSSNALSQIRSTLPNASVTVHAGSDRFDTAARVARAVWPSGSRAVFHAPGDSFPDALAGTPSAYVNAAPILLTKSACTPLATVNAVKALQPTLQVALGGTAVTYLGSRACSS